MSAYIRYIGTETNWEELPYTGRRCRWQPGWADECPDDIVAQLLATGLFAEVVDANVVATSVTRALVVKPKEASAYSGNVLALSEVHAYETLTASGLAFTGPCEFSGVIVSAISGTPQTIEVYDNTSATGTPVVTLSATALETKHALGSPGAIQFATGCYVAITGGTSRTLRVLVQ